MKISERYLWIAALILVAFIAQNSSKQTENALFLTESYRLECEIKNSQINDFNNQRLQSAERSYSRGFQDGRSQAGIAFSQGRPMLDYSDGYHAALTQFTSEESLESELLRELEKDMAQSNDTDEIQEK